MPHRSQQRVGPMETRGFTVIELMVTVAILAIIAAIAVPSFTNLVRGNRVVSSANEMVAMLQTARAAAITNRASVSVCPTANGTACTGTLGNRWIAVMTKNAVTTVLRDSTLNPAITVRSSTNLSSGSNRFTFTPNGFSAAGGNASGTVSLCSAQMSGNNAADVSASVGRISTARRAATAACTAPADN